MERGEGKFRGGHFTLFSLLLRENCPGASSPSMRHVQRQGCKATKGARLRQLQQGGARRRVPGEAREHPRSELDGSDDDERELRAGIHVAFVCSTSRCAKKASLLRGGPA